MRIIDPEVREVLFHLPEGYTNVESWLEQCGRVCYKSEDKAKPDSAPKFVARLRQNSHLSVIEHAVASVKIIADRGFTHELVRHRIAAYSQESTRYCNYSKDKFRGEITVVKPVGLPPLQARCWQSATQAAESAYFEMLAQGAATDEARAVLPISVKTEIVATANLREWRHILNLRCSGRAHPTMRYVMREVLWKMNNITPSVFEDIAERHLQNG